jgi:hypothetical protein
VSQREHGSPGRKFSREFAASALFEPSIVANDAGETGQLPA